MNGASCRLEHPRPGRATDFLPDDWKRHSRALVCLSKFSSVQAVSWKTLSRELASCELSEISHSRKKCDDGLSSRKFGWHHDVRFTV